ncbi:TonB-dependent siderophore receptor [Methylosinus sp. PW1]|uniref:TonB-dependent siderophore receptor n=1 Tax=Methylosinus sp. PW1 TaxID=107636 RepID=UPI0005698196|nr:TonB-dependent siderophore receptor [Methylosinus sp. PW1]
MGDRAGYGRRRGDRKAIATTPAIGLLCVAAILPSVASDEAHADEATSLPPIDVGASAPPTRDQALQRDGAAGDGYRANLLSSPGFFDQQKILDLPYSFSVVSSDFITNTLSPSGDKALAMTPSVQVTSSDSSGVGARYLSRGFNMTTAIDGFVQSMGNFGSIAVEDKERIEQLSGVSGFLYGATNYQVGGVVNYVTKRPTATPLASITVGNRGGTSGYAHGDFSGPLFGSDRIGYRINVAGQGLGDTAIQNQSIRKGLISGALDFRLTDTTLIQLDYSHQDWKIWGPTLTWDLRGLYVSAPDLSSRGGAPRFSYAEWINNRAGVRWRSDPVSFLSLRGGFQYNDTKENFLYATNLQVANDGSYSQFLNKSIGYDVRDFDGNAFADLKFDLFGTKSTFTTGYSIHDSILLQPASNRQLAYPKGFNLFNDDQSSTAAQNASALAAGLNPNGSGPAYKSWQYRFQSIPFVERLEIGEALTLLMGANYARVTEWDWDTSLGSSTLGQVTGRYSASRMSPSGSIIFKPIPTVSTYFTYQEGLTIGGVASQTYRGLPVSNPGPAPARASKSLEVGAKATIGDMLVTAALFDITRSSSVYALDASGTSYTYSPDGLEAHKGVEIGVSGKLTDNISLFGGGTAMDTKITSQPNNPSLVGQMPSGVSNYLAKLYGEYSVDEIPGLTLTAGFQYYSRQLITNASTGPLLYIPGYAVASLGGRYKFDLYGKQTTFALNIDNLTNHKYWSTPSLPGEPLTVRLSATMHF